MEGDTGDMEVDTKEEPTRLSRPRLTTVRAGAVAGMLFALLFMTSLALLRSAVPASPLDAGEWLKTKRDTVVLAINLVPFAGIAFLWFMAVVRERVAALEDRFFATVFLGSGLLFLAMLFVSAAVVGGIVIAYGATPSVLTDSTAYALLRAVTYQSMNIYAVRMAGVFMMVTSTIARRSKIIPRWMVYSGYLLALSLLVSVGAVDWIAVLFPVWVLALSVYLEVEDLLKPASGIAQGASTTKPAPNSQA